MPRIPALFTLVLLWGIVAAGELHSQQPATPEHEVGAHIISPKLCFTLVIPGTWVPANDPGSYRTPDGSQFVGVLQFTVSDLKKAKGNSLIEKEAASVEEAYQKALKKKLSNVKLETFESSPQGMWKWSAALPAGSDKGFHTPKRYIFDLSPDGVIVLNIEGTTDDDDLARRIIATLRYSRERPCQLPTSTKELLREITAPSKPTTGTPPDTESTATRVYQNPSFPWSVTYPDGWTLNLTSPGQLQILHPGPGDQAGCSFFSVAVQFTSVDEFSNFWITQADQDMKRRGIGVRRGTKQSITLPNQIVGVSVTTEILAGGRSRSVFVLADGVGYMMDCETSAKSWDRFATSFERIINSFTIEKKP